GALNEEENLDNLIADLTKDVLQKNESDVRATLPIASYTSSQVVTFGVNRGKNKLEMKNENKYDVADFVVKLTVKIPDNHDLSISNKYHDLTLDSYSGRVRADIYNAKLSLGVIGGDADVNVKYGSIQIGIAREININLYDSKLTLEKAAGLKLNTKYSRVKIGEVRELNINSFDDEISVESNLDMLSYSSKYSSIHCQNIEKLKASMYDDHLEAKSITEASISAKYTSIQADKISRISMSSSYDNSFSCGTVGLMKVSDSKYSSYKIDLITNSLTTYSHDDTWKVKALENEVASFNVSAKYGSVDVGFNKELAHIIRYEGKCGDFDYPNIDYTTEKSEVVDGEKRLILKSGSGKAAFNFRVYCTNIHVSLN
ncbi:MAG: hypothetical protein KDC92_08575, partial [Bacteroidetes bacterium]|nr:hypothetical protein [Bacteroidota bacterium]